MMNLMFVAPTAHPWSYPCGVELCAYPIMRIALIQIRHAERARDERIATRFCFSQRATKVHSQEVATDSERERERYSDVCFCVVILVATCIINTGMNEKDSVIIRHFHYLTQLFSSCLPTE